MLACGKLVVIAADSGHSQRMKMLQRLTEVITEKHQSDLATQIATRIGKFFDAMEVVSKDLDVEFETLPCSRYTLNEIL